MDRQRLDGLAERMEARASPVLTLYASVNPALPEHSPRAVVARARATLTALGVPDALAGRALDRLEPLAQEARTVVVFADHAEVEAVPLAVDLPVEDPATGLLEARYGRPHVAPLRALLDGTEPFGAVVLDGDGWRFLAIDLGEIEEVERANRPYAPDELDEEQGVRQARVVWYASRDNATRQRFADHRLEWQLKFLREVAARADALTRERGIGHLALVGPERMTTALAALLTEETASRVVATLPPLAEVDAPPRRLLERLRPVLDAHRRAAEAAVLDSIRDGGVRSVEGCLAALERHQLALVAMPASTSARVYVEESSGHAAMTHAAASRHAAGTARVVERPLAEVVATLARASRARLLVLRGEAEARLLAELGGLGGLRRW